jgi:hypothetical protein
MEDPVFIAKIVGAALAFAAGIWIGLGTPGLDRPPPSGSGRPIDRLNATWINRAFFKMAARPRRFDIGRIVPPGKNGAPAAGGDEDSAQAEREERSLRLPRP